MLVLSKLKEPVLADLVEGEFDQAIHRDMHDHEGYLYMVTEQGDAKLKALMEWFVFKATGQAAGQLDHVTKYKNKESFLQ